MQQEKTLDTQENPHNEEKPYLLIADDYQDTLELLCTAVQARGWLCRAVETPQQILDAVREERVSPGVTKFDALITDINYQTFGPDEIPRTGVSVVRELRKEFPNIPVIFITAANTYGLRKEALAVGQELVTKPFEVDYILRRAEVWMNWAKPMKYKLLGNDRRRYGINRSGNYRRGTDTLIMPDGKAAPAPTEKESEQQNVRKATANNDRRGEQNIHR